MAFASELRRQRLLSPCCQWHGHSRATITATFIAASRYPVTAQTISQKSLARAAGLDAVAVGDIVTCRVDLAMMHDSGGPRRVASKLLELGASVWDPSKVVIVSDHFTPAIDVDSAGILALTRRWAAAQQIDNFHDGEGICHVILPERGYLKP